MTTGPKTTGRTPAPSSPAAARTPRLEPDVCQSCGAPRSGEYCPACGERRHDRERESLPRLVSDAVGGLFSLDGRWPRAFIGLLLRPGELAAEWSSGRRAHWPKPLSVFLFANLLYFFFAAKLNIAILRTPLIGHLRATPWAAWLRRRIAADPEWGEAESVAIAAGRFSELGGDFERFALLFDAHADHISKVIVGVLIPLFAALLSLAHRGRGRQLMDEWVLSAHFISWWLLVVLLGAWSFIRWVMRASYSAFPELAELPGDVISVPLLLGLSSWWLATAEKRICPDRSWPRRWLVAILLSLGFLALAVYPFRWLEFEVAWLTYTP